MRKLLLLGLVTALLPACTDDPDVAGDTTLTVFAASSLTDAFTESVAVASTVAVAAAACAEVADSDRADCIAAASVAGSDHAQATLAAAQPVHVTEEVSEHVLGVGAERSSAIERRCRRTRD